MRVALEGGRFTGIHGEDRRVEARRAVDGAVGLRTEIVRDGRCRIDARHAHRIGRLGADGRVVLVDGEAHVRRERTAELPDRVVDADALPGGVAAHDAADPKLARGVVDVVDEPLAGEERQLGEADQAGDVLVANAIALDRDLVPADGGGEVPEREAGPPERLVWLGGLEEDFFPGERSRGHEDDGVTGDRDHLVVHGQGSAAQQIRVSQRRVLDEADDDEGRDRLHGPHLGHGSACPQEARYCREGRAEREGGAGPARSCFDGGVVH